MSEKKEKLPILLEQELIFYNYVYELYLNEIPITNYKKHLSQNKFEAFLIDSLDKEDFVLSMSIYYLNYLIMNDKIITNSSISYFTSKNNDVLAEAYNDVLNILSLCSQIFIMIEQGDYEDLKTKMFSIYKLCKAMYLLGQNLTSLYVKEGEFLKEVQNGYIELIKNQINSDLENKLLVIHSELKELKKHLVEKELSLFDIVGDLKNKLFSKYFTNEEKNKTKLIKISKDPFIYWDENRCNMLSVMNLHFMEKSIYKTTKELQQLKDIENITTSLILFFEYEYGFWKQKSYNSIALNFFMDNHSVMKYSYITKNEDDIKDFLKKYYNYTSIESFAFKKGIKSLFNEIVKNNKNDLVSIFKEINRKLPSFISDNNLVIANNEKISKDELVRLVSIKCYGLLVEVLDNDK